jgi:hypothetical protein
MDAALVVLLVVLVIAFWYYETHDMLQLGEFNINTLLGNS